MGNLRSSLVILNIDSGLAYLGESGEFEKGLCADESDYLKHQQGSGLPWRVSGEFENGDYADQSGYPHFRQRSLLP